MNSTKPLEQHYATDGLKARLDESLANAGLMAGSVDWTKLAQLDQFHTRGLAAVKELADILNPKAGESVLDLGSGFGGPARYLAAVHDCQVTGIELTQAYVDISNYLSELTGLADKTRFIQGDATTLPFDDESFDLAWTIHVSMNIKDKDGFYRGVYRTLKKGGKFAIYDIVQGEGGQVIYPAPWSPTEEFSFLSTIAETESLLKSAGFKPLKLEDATQDVLTWFDQMVAAPPAEVGAEKRVTMTDVIGSHIVPMLKNLGRNYKEGRTRAVMAVVQKD